MSGLTQNLSYILLMEDKTASKTMDAVAVKAEQTTHRIGTAFSKAGGIVGGEFGGILDEVGTRIDNTGGKAAKLSTGLMVGGGVATVTGVALLKMGSSYQQATDQLDQASKTAGDSVKGMSGKVEEAVKTAENFDHGAVDTKDALAKLTEASGSTQKALDLMQVTTNLAAARHISLSDAATMVNRIMGGSGSKILTQYGIVMEKASDPTKALASAQAGVTSASDKLAAAQKKLADLQEVDHAKKKLTVADHIALQNAQDTVTKASANLDSAQKKLNDTSTVTITKQQAGTKALDELSKKLDGQGKASVSNFGSQVDIMRTKVQDWVDQVSGPVGSVLAGLGPAFTIAGVAVDLYRTKKEAATLAEIANATAATVATTATEGEATAMVALDASMDANPIGIVALAIGGLAAIAGGIALGGQKDLTQATQNYTSALDSNSGALDSNLRKVAAKALLDDGSLAAANKLGIATSVVVDATLGNKDAQNQLNDALKVARSSYENVNDPAATLVKVENSLSGQAAVTRDAVKLLSGSVDDQSSALAAARRNADLYNSSLNTIAQPRSAAQISVSNKLATLSHHAGGGDMHQGGYTVVGEQGPELAYMPGGSKIWPSGSGPSSSGSGGTSLTINVNAAQGDQRTIGKAVVDAIITASRSGAFNPSELKRALGG